MKRISTVLSFFALLLLATGLFAADKTLIKKNVDDIVNAINNGRTATSYAANSYTPYVFIMDAKGRLLVHPELKGEYLQEKGAPIFEALQQATAEGKWVSYFWRGAEKHTYVRKTSNNLTVGSGN